MYLFLQTIEVKSDVSVYRGRVIFDGKLSFSFSRDERKNIVMTSRVEDVSVGPNSMNYRYGLCLAYLFPNTTNLQQTTLKTYLRGNNCKFHCCMMKICLQKIQSSLTFISHMTVTYLILYYKRCCFFSLNGKIM